MPANASLGDSAAKCLATGKQLLAKLSKWNWRMIKQLYKFSTKMRVNILKTCVLLKFTVRYNL